MAVCDEVGAKYGIPVVETRIVESVDRAVEAGDSVGYPLALAVLSPDIAHRWDVGGVGVDLAVTTGPVTGAVCRIVPPLLNSTRFTRAGNCAVASATGSGLPVARAASSRFDASLARRNTNPKKIYCVDHALVRVRAVSHQIARRTAHRRAAEAPVPGPAGVTAAHLELEPVINRFKRSEWDIAYGASGTLRAARTGVMAA